MATWTEALRRAYFDLVSRRARVRVTPAVEPESGEPPIFLIGPYRSGTTLLRYVVDSHSRIACPPETSYLAQLEALVADRRSLAGFDGMGFDREHVIRRINRFARYFYENYAASHGKSRWADKSPNYLAHLPFLREVFPEARFVMIFRDPLDQIYSHTRGGDYLPDQLTGFCEPGEDARGCAARYWRDATTAMLDFMAEHPDACHRVGYEALCAEPEAELRSLFAFLDEQWEPAVLEFYRFDHDQGLEDGRVGATRGFTVSTGKYLAWSEQEIARCREIVAPVAAGAGYPAG